MRNINKHLAHKLCRLSSFLHHACQEFENITKKIKDKKIRMSLRSFALKTNQYTRELDSQLQMLRIACPHQGIKDHTEKNGDMNRNISDKRIIHACCHSEVYFEKAYRSILNEFFPYKSLRDLLRYQITGLYSAFRQLKLLDSVMTIPQTSFN